MTPHKCNPAQAQLWVIWKEFYFHFHTPAKYEYITNFFLVGTVKLKAAGWILLNSFTRVHFTHVHLHSHIHKTHAKVSILRKQNHSKAWHFFIKHFKAIFGTGTAIESVDLRMNRIWKWRRQWHPTPVLLLGKSHGWRSLVGRSP